MTGLPCRTPEQWADPFVYCPGFNLWSVYFEDGTAVTIPADNPDGAKFVAHYTAFGSRGLRATSVECLGPNPAVEVWNSTR